MVEMFMADDDDDENIAFLSPAALVNRARASCPTRELTECTDTSGVISGRPRVHRSRRA
jgi:hypothetical protein